MIDNYEAWDKPEVVSYFNNNRVNVEDIYPSEWFFIKNVLKNNVTVLDIGCAQGGFSRAIGEILGSFSYTGIDISKNMIARAKVNYPQHTFFHLEESDDYSILNKGEANGFDVTLALGILHLHSEWRETIKKAWHQTSGVLILDLRVVCEESIEDKNKSYFEMNFNGTNSDQVNVLPYNLINAGEALSIIKSICTKAKKISFYGHSQKVSDSAVSPIESVFANVYCIER